MALNTKEKKGAGRLNICMLSTIYVSTNPCINNKMFMSMVGSATSRRNANAGKQV